MKNLPRHNRARSTNYVPLVALSVCAVVLFGVDMLSGGMVRGTVQNASGTLFASVGSAVHGIEGSGVFASKQGLAEENIALRTQLASLQSLTLENETLVEENESLRALTGAVGSIANPRTFSVLSYEDASPYGTFIIDGGADKGVLAGSLVYAEGGALVGTVERVAAHTAQVYAILAPGREIAARVGSSTQTTLYGRGGGNGAALVPRDVEVSEGDFVYYQATGAVIGEVGAIQSSSADAEKTLFIRTPLNLYGVRHVLISL